MLDNKKNRFSIKTSYIWIAALILFFSVSMNYDWRTGYIAWYGSLLLLAASYFLAFKGKMLLKNLSFFGWMLSFIVWGCVSIIWCLSANMAIDIIKSFIVCFAVLLLIQFALNYEFSIDTILTVYFLATLINAIYIVLTVDLTQVGEIQIGKSMLDAWNGNGIGIMMAQGVLIACYLLPKVNFKLLKIFYLICIVALSYLVIYTGSRTAFIMLVAELLLYFWLSHPTKLIRNILVSVIVVIVALYLVMNVESFYNVLGVRLEGLFALFGAEGKVDSSANIRDVFIQNGIKWFSEHPIFGVGLNNYKVLNGVATGRVTYSHNNFIEIAVNLGAIGLIWYYSVYVYLGVKLFRIIKEDSLNVFLLSALIASLLSHYGDVAYYGFYQNFLLLLCFFAIHKAKKERISN